MFKRLIPGSLLNFSLVLLSLYLSLSPSMAQQSGMLKGKVLTSDNKPAVAVTITLRPGGKMAITNDEGIFMFNRVIPGTYTMKVSLIGHHEVERQITITEGKTAETKIHLTSSVAMLTEVAVTTASTRFAKKQSDFVARMPLNNLENPQVYTVVPKELLQEQQVIDFRTALQVVPGLTNVTNGVGSGGMGLSIRLRGFSGSNNVGAIRNGMATNFVSLSDPVNLESIEVIKGPSSTLFGSSTLVSYGGLINRVTKKPFDVFKGEVGYSAGSYGLSRLTVDLNTPVNEDKSLLFRFDGAYANENSWQDYGKTMTRVAAPSLTYKANNKLSLDLDFEVLNVKRNTTYIGSIPNTYTGNARSFDDLRINFKQSFTNNQFLSESKVFNGYAKATYKINSSWTSQTAFSYGSTENTANYLFLALSSDTTFSRNVMNIPSSFGVNQVQQNLVGDFKLGTVRNRMLLGADYLQITTNDRRTKSLKYDDIVFTRPSVADLSVEKYNQMQATAERGANFRNYKTLSAYASDVISMSAGFSAMASIRVDRYESVFDDYKQTSWSPKFGLVYQVLKDKVSLFGNYMDGFTNQAPAILEDNPAEKSPVKPEHARQTEGGMKLELLGGRLNGTLSYYSISVENKLRLIPGSNTVYTQDGTQKSKGFEADLIANPIRGLHIIMGYGYNDSKYTKVDSSVAGLRVTSAPEHTGNLWLSYKLPEGAFKGWGLGFGGNLQSDAFFVNSRPKVGKTTHYNPNPFQFRVPGYVRLDASIFYEQQKYRFGVKMNNISNEKYWSTDAYALREAPRMVNVNLTYKF